MSLGDDSYLPSVDHLIAFGLDSSGFLKDNIDLLRAIEAEKGIGYVASQLGTDNFGPDGYNWQYRVNLRTIDESKTMLYGEIRRIQTLVKKAVRSSSADDKTHYESLLYKLNLTNVL